MKKTGFSHTAIRQHLGILKMKGILKLTNRPQEIGNSISQTTTLLLNKDFHNKIFDSLLTKFRTYDEASKFLEIQKGTLSAWKVRKNRIPLNILKQICKISEIEEKYIYKNIEKVDREIAEII